MSGNDGEGLDLLSLDPHERAAAGLFLGFQYPVEIPGISYLQFLRESLNSQRRSRGEPELSAGDFIKVAREVLKQLPMEFAVEAQKLLGISLEGSVA